MSEVASLIADLVAEGVRPELIGRIAAALSRREVVIVGDEQADRRRERDRIRKHTVRGNPQTSAECADRKSSPSIEEENTNSKKIEAPRKPSAEKRASRLSAEWTLPAEWRAIAVDLGCADPESQAARFGDHFRGNGVRKVDWLATWRNWIRKAPDFAPQPKTAQQPRASPQIDIAPRDRVAELKPKAELLKSATPFARDSAQRYPRQDVQEMLALKLLTVADLQKIGYTLPPRAVG